MLYSRAISIVVGLLASVSNGAKTPSKSTLNVGMMFVDMTQYLDTGPIDLLAMMGESYVSAFMLGGKIDEQKLKMNIYYISENGKTPIGTTAGLKILPTTSFDNAPPLDILVIPGGNPMHPQTPKERAFVRNITDSPNTIATMTICTGVNILASSGALAGHNATAPYILYPLLEKKHPQVNWSWTRWVSTANGKLWTSGSIGNGLDMVAAFMRDYFWDRPELVELVLTSSAVGDRGKEYSEVEKRVFGSLDFSKHLKMHEEGDLGSGNAKPGGMAGMDHGDMGGMDPGMNHGDMAGMNHGKMA